MQELERYWQDCPSCDGIITDDDVTFGRVTTHTDPRGVRWLKQRVSMLCPHCRHREQRTLRRIVGRIAPPGHRQSPEAAVCP